MFVFWKSSHFKIVKRTLPQVKLLFNKNYSNISSYNKPFSLLSQRGPVNWTKHIQCSYKYMSTDSSKDKPKSQYLMDFEPIVMPGVIMAIKNFILVKLIIQPYLDKEFSVKEFIRGAKQAIVMVSTFLANGNFEALTGLVDNEALTEIKKNHSLLNVKERQELSVKLSDILFTFPYQIGLIFDDNTQKRFCEITVVYHVLRGYSEMKPPDRALLETAKDDVTVCNYRFIREYTKGVQGNWMINQLGHFHLIHLESQNQ